jgi:hypothetical protein
MSLLAYVFSPLSLTPTFKWVGDRAGSGPNRFSGFWLAFRRDSHIGPCSRGLDGAIAGDPSEKPLKRFGYSSAVGTPT